LVLESGDPREVHHFSLLLGYGCGAINPYLAFESIEDLISQGLLVGVDHKTACKNFVKAAVKGVVKVASKMGISTIQSYRGAQIFEAVGISESVVDKYFTWTSTRVEGIGMEEIAGEVDVFLGIAVLGLQGRRRLLQVLVQILQILLLRFEHLLGVFLGGSKLRFQFLGFRMRGQDLLKIHHGDRGLGTSDREETQ
jgi:hypothetical protein